MTTESDIKTFKLDEGTLTLTFQDSSLLPNFPINFIDIELKTAKEEKYDLNYDYKKFKSLEYFKNFTTFKSMFDALVQKIEQKSFSIIVNSTSSVLTITDLFFEELIKVELVLRNKRLKNKIDESVRMISSIQPLRSRSDIYCNNYNNIYNNDYNNVYDEQNIENKDFINSHEDLNYELLLAQNEINTLNQKLILKENEIDQLKNRVKILEDQVIMLNLQHYNKNLKDNTFSKSQRSLIKNISEQIYLKEWIGLGENVKFNLLYDSDRDNDSAEAFHERCDNIGPTLTIIESDNGLRFGGYTALTWDSPEIGYFKENNRTAFIFSLSKLQKFVCKNQTKVIYCSKHISVAFGGGNDIVVYDKFLTNHNSGISSIESYDLKGIDKPYNHLAGSQCFRVKKVEVYQVEK